MLFTEARDFARGLSLKNAGEWVEYAKGNLLEKGTKPETIPAAPRNYYWSKGWVSWGDWLGTEYVHKKDFWPCEEAKAYVHKLNLESPSQWREYSAGRLEDTKGKKPEQIPANPSVTYKNKDWKGWPDFLGTAKKK